jgi:hypothetical protein
LVAGFLSISYPTPLDFATVSKLGGEPKNLSTLAFVRQVGIIIRSDLRRRGTTFAMPYSAEISRTNPTCLLFMVDQSKSMNGPFGGQEGKKKKEGVADAINRLLQNLVLKCAKSEGIRDYFHLGVIGYGGKSVSAALGGQLSGQALIPISVLANCPIRLEVRNRKVDDGAGGLIEQSFRFPIWFEPVADGRTPMCKAFGLAHQTLAGFVERFPQCFPPIVIHLTDGEATDGDPELASAALRSLKTQDGDVLLFNLHLSSSQKSPVVFPDSDIRLADDYARLLFNMSSVLPKKLLAAAESDGYDVNAHSRGFAFNADLVSVIRFLDIGTRVANNLR